MRARWLSQTLLLLSFSIPVMVSAEQNSIQRAREWVTAQDFTCTLGDGYRCLDVAEKADTRPSAGVVVPAIYLPIWALSYRDFQTLGELTEEQKALRHYRISFQETAEHYVIEFRGLLLPAVDTNGQVSGVLPAIYGLSVRYLIDKKSRKISSRQFMR